MTNAPNMPKEWFYDAGLDKIEGEMLYNVSPIFTDILASVPALAFSLADHLGVTPLAVLQELWELSPNALGLYYSANGWVALASQVAARLDVPLNDWIPTFH